MSSFWKIFGAIIVACFGVFVAVRVTAPHPKVVTHNFTTTVHQTSTTTQTNVVTIYVKPKTATSPAVTTAKPTDPKKLVGSSVIPNLVQCHSDNSNCAKPPTVRLQHIPLHGKMLWCILEGTNRVSCDWYGYDNGITH